MNAERFLEIYHKISATQDCVERMRRFVLDLAVRGKLVEQDTNDEPASELLERITDEKLKISKHIKASKHTSAEMNEDFFPLHSVPKSWTWTHVAKLGLINPRNVAEDDIEVSFVSMPLIAAKYGLEHKHEPRRWAAIKKGYTHFAEGDVGIAKITPCFENGKSTVFRNLMNGIGSGTTELFILRPLFAVAEYVLIYFKTKKFIESGTSRMTGTAGQKRLPADYFSRAPFPLPPLAEQHRIVEKVNELMMLCDRIEQARKGQESTRDRLTVSCLGQLTDSANSKEEFRRQAGFVVDNVKHLTESVEQVKQLKQTILDLAVRGKLVQQDRDDDPVEELSNRIKRERQKLMGFRSNRKNWVISDDVIEPLFEVPSTWQWERFGNIVDFQAGKTPNRNEPSFWSPGKFPWVTIADMVDGGELISTREKVSELAKLEKFKTDPVPQGTMIMSFKLTIGKITRLGTPAYHNEAIIAITPYLLELDPFVFRFLPMFAKQGNKKNAIKGATLNQTSLSNILIPLPPLAEQHRIVARVDEMMMICEKLETTIQKRESQRVDVVNSMMNAFQIDWLPVA